MKNKMLATPRMAKKIKRTALVVLAFSFFPTPNGFNAAVRDYFVTSTEHEGVYMGRLESAGIIANANPADIFNHWAHEPIIHAMAVGAFNFGASGVFSPNALLTNEEAIAFAVNTRGLGYRVNERGLEIWEELIELGIVTLGTLPDVRHLGYIGVAYDEDLINTLEYESFIGILEVETGEEANGEAAEAIFYPAIRGLLVEREQFAALMARALRENNSIVFPNQPAAMLSFSDWQTVSPQFAQYVEALARVSAMGAGGSFRPAENITRAEAAQVLRNLDEIFQEENELSRRFGTVAYYRDIQELATLQGEVRRNYLIRRYDGLVDVLQHQVIFSPAGQLINYNTVVFRDGIVGGFELLEIDDQIEYIVRAEGENSLVLYINVVQTEQVISRVAGRLIRVDIDAGTITLRDNNENEFIYTMQAGTFGENADGVYIFLDYRRTHIEDLPFGAFIELELVNNLVHRAYFIGQPELVSELRGIVMDNNPAFGYITFIDNNANIVTRFYNKNDMRVTRDPHYSTVSGASYLAAMFPNAVFDPLTRTIADIVPGDIIFMRFESEDPTLITSISAAANFSQRFGLVRGVSQNEDVVSVLLQFDNGTTSWFDLGQNVFITRAGLPVSNNSIEIGDRLRLLVNQAVLGPGHIVESVLEVSLEGQGHHIGQILTGNLAGINNLQNQLMLQNAMPLTGSGWGSHSQIRELSLGRQNIDFFHEGARVSADHVSRFLSRSNLQTYIALDQSPTGDTIRQVTFRDGRGELLQPDVVMSTTGGGEFMIASINGNISTDPGTIVRRNGRQVTPNEIFEGDFVRVSLTGGNRASVVDITEAPATSAINIARVRIAEINPGQSFTVTAMSTLSNGEWLFTPVERLFTINPNTIFINLTASDFTDIGEGSRIDDTFTIVYDGAAATHIIDAPFANRSTRGTVVSSHAVGALLRDAEYLQHSPTTNPVPIPQWRPISNQNPTINLNTNPATIIIRNNQIIRADQLQQGDRVRVLSHGLPEIEAGMEVIPVIVLVEG
ncbi:MAG: S-layer homology domain-containing protein [Defluviitaleaceae bacterium]|nr:S-layer homology domain-containing protein [Defluviitaleaceae bacterium]